MPYLPITLPSRGLHVDSAYSSLPPGFTLDSLNVLPYDAYKGKQRLGQRRALLGAFQFNTIPTSATREVQAIVRADAYVNSVLTQRCVVVAGGEVYIIDPGVTTPVAATYAASTSKLNSTGDISVAIFGNYAYFADGNKYRRMNITVSPASSAVVEFWGTVLSNVVVHNTTGHFQSDVATLSVGDPIVVTGTFAAGGGNITGYTFQETFYVKTIVSATAPYEFELTRDPVVATGAAIATTKTGASGSTTGVTFITSGPEMTIKPPSINVGAAKAEAGARASLLVRFGGRLALSGFIPSPNNWFLSKINDVDDWVPGSTPDDAVAGNLSTKFSIPGEPIVAIIPMAESGLLFAGRHTMTYLSADPVFETQARMIELSRSVGIVSAKAWCVSDAQTVYIMAQDGLYRVRPNEFQVTQSGRITGGRLDSFFQSQKFDQLNCSLGFDPEIQNIYCILSRTDLPSSSTHLVYSQATDSFWTIRTGWTAFQAPSCIGEFPFGDARSPVLALGSEDGYIGWFDRDLTSGVDGQAAVGYKGGPFDVTNDEAAAQKIVSSLTIGPVVSPNLSQVMLRDMRVELTMDEPQEEQDFNTPNVRLTGPFLSILSGQTAEEAIGEAIVNVTVTYDPSFPAVVLDGGDVDTAPTYTNTYDGGNVNTSPSYPNGIDLGYAQSLAPHTYTTTDTLITDPTARTYSFGANRIYNLGTAPSNNWAIQNVIGLANTPTLFIRDESLPGTSLDTPGGVYVYGDGGTVLPLPTLPGSSPSPRIVVSSGTYTNTNYIQIGELQSGRNDALRCRIRDQAVFARIDSYGVPWAIERMAALIDPMPHTKNVKGTY